MKTCISCNSQVDDTRQICPRCRGTIFIQAMTERGFTTYAKTRQKQSDAAKHVDRGALLIMQGQYKDAEKELRKAIEINPNNATAHGNMGGVFLEQNQPKKAIPWLEKALRLNPHLEGIPQALAQAKALEKKLSQPKMSGIITCPKCKMRVFLKADGTCPSCQAKIVED